MVLPNFSISGKKNWHGMEGPEKFIGEIMEVAGEQEARVGVGFGGDADANKTLRVTCDSRPQSIRQ